jgi:hypothetical protein
LDSSMDSFDCVKLPLPKYLKIFTNAGMPVPKAMEISGKLYKTYNTPGTLKDLTHQKLIQSGLHEKEERKLVTSALRKAGYQSKLRTSGSAPGSRTTAALDALDNPAGPSSTNLSTVEAIVRRCTSPNAIELRLILFRLPLLRRSDCGKRVRMNSYPHERRTSLLSMVVWTLGR